jgi:hypothetical protein
MDSWLVNIYSGGRNFLAFFVLIVGWAHALLKPIGEWFTVTVLGVWEETTKVGFCIAMCKLPAWCMRNYVLAPYPFFLDFLNKINPELMLCDGHRASYEDGLQRELGMFILSLQQPYPCSL